ncbi:hypothetical protein [Paraburkholderia aromaticivorans]|uniref:DUF4148 domain-containing protein n=1 Tax=Paraburkholderia aromaticivorans TaxID=2026199 RepID=A0A248VVA7_9BURK|nr:hypothetical protein [Paraburkholderia aromaticivorans]ASW02290.1 hypothetical protein CJU94_29750 [Paraburkholderia aromaticivorans]
MKRLFPALLIALATVGTTQAWAQSAASSSAQGTQSSDAIVRMRSEIRTANETYRARVRAANQARDREVAKAQAERTKAIEAAQSGGGNS